MKRIVSEAGHRQPYHVENLTYKDTQNTNGLKISHLIQNPVRQIKISEINGRIESEGRYWIVTQDRLFYLIFFGSGYQPYPVELRLFLNICSGETNGGTLWDHILCWESYWDWN